MNTYMIKIVLITYALWAGCFSSLLARAQANPFAPLTPASTNANIPTTPSPPQSMGYFAEHIGVVDGILWHVERPVAIIENQPFTVGAHYGAGRITAIRPNAVEITDEQGDPLVLYVSGGLVTDTPEPPPEGREDWVHLHIDEVSSRVAMEALAFQADLNVVFVGEVDQPISLHMAGVSRQGAAEAVLQASGCVMAWEGRTITVEKWQDRLVSKTFPLNYGNSKDLEKAILKLVSDVGKVGIDERLNALVVTDTLENLERIEKAIVPLDKKAPQVLIEVLIVNVILTEERKMGVDWQVVGSSVANEGLTLTQELTATTQVNPFSSVSFRTVSGDWSFYGLLDFVQNHEDVTVLASPKVMVLNNHMATIDAVEEIPYQELSQTSGGGLIGTTAFKEAGVKLAVRPQITDDGYIVMHIQPEQSARVGTYTVDGSDVPIIETRKSETNLRVKDGQTIIIGGLRKKQPFRKESRVPLLGDLPVLGKLFRQVHEKEVDSELGVFITPHIYRDDALPQTDLALVDAEDDLEALWQKKIIPDKKRMYRK